MCGIVADKLPRRLLDSLVVGRVSTPIVAWQSCRQLSAIVDRTIETLRDSRYGSRGFEKAEVTAGGVALDEVDSRDMQSKLVPNLIWRAKFSIWMDSSAATTFRPRSVLAGLRARVLNKESIGGSLSQSRSRLPSGTSIGRNSREFAKVHSGRRDLL